MLIGGGVRAGKSAYAVQRALQSGPRRVYVATAEALDDEMRARAQAHREERGNSFDTLEVSRELVPALRDLEGTDVVVIDCLTMWVSNLLLDGLDEAAIRVRVGELADLLASRPFNCLIVSNEVGMGIVPDNALARSFRDAVGRAHQQLGAVADELIFAAMGQLIRIKPSPIEVVDVPTR